MIPELMKPDHQPDLDEIFHAAIERATASERQAYLDGACSGNSSLRSRAEALLAAHDEATGFLEQPLVTPAAEKPLGAAPGSHIGPYKLLQEIGEGGMGVVFMAEQERPVRRKVALKIIKLGMDTKQVIARFEAERQALALMAHPNIASVLDAGATESGRPYFVMELVRGIPIDEYCDKHQLSTGDRLLLFMDTCRAVQHAHHKGVIHRDIKPGNVLVTSHDGTPVVKIIDFGVAKATNQKLTEKTLFTEFRQLIGTPEYMSPEQAEMSGLDVDTRTDIYALGVLLYRLLTGSTPFDAKTLRTAEYAEMTRMIREDEPHTPSTRITKLGAALADIARSHATDPGALAKLLRGDLDWIVMKAIAKDRTRRYDSASGFADDIERHLRSEPVLAGPPSTLYRAKKLFERNRTLVLATGVASLSILAGLGMALSGYFTAKAEADRSQKISSTLTGMLGVAGTGDALDVDVSEVLATAREVFGDDHATVAATLAAMAGQLRNAGDPQGSEQLFREALATYRNVYGNDHRTVGRTYARLGAIQSLNGAMEEAEASLREALRIEALQPGVPDPSGCATRQALASVLSTRGMYDEAQVLLRETLVLLRENEADRSFEIFTVTEKLLEASIQDPARPDLFHLYDDIVVAANDAFPPGHTIPAIVRFGRAMYLFRTSRNDLAEPALREVAATFRAMETPQPVYLVATLDALFQVTRKDPAKRADADAALIQFLEVAPSIWGSDEAILGENYGAAFVRFHRSGRLSDALVYGEAYYQYAERNRDAGDLRKLTERLFELMLDVVRQDAPPVEDLEQALAILVRIPPDEYFGLPSDIMRALVLFRLGRDTDVDATFQLVREAADSTTQNGRAALNLLRQAENLVERLR